jgi:hypothetical protein
MPTHKPGQRRGLTVDHRRALVLLASCPEGCTESVMRAHGFRVEQIVALVRAGRAHAQTERIFAGVHMIEVTRMRITDAGRRAIQA